MPYNLVFWTFTCREPMHKTTALIEEAVTHQQLPIIGLSGESNTEVYSLKKPQDAGMMTFLPKGFKAKYFISHDR